MHISAKRDRKFDKELEKIHQTALKILSELGVHVDHAGMCEKLEGNGCRISGGRVYIPPEVVAKTVEKIPHRFNLYGRREKVAYVNSEGPPLCTNTGILPNIIDFESGAVRRSTQRDVETTTRVLDALSEIDIVYVSLVDATEVPSHMITLTDFAATLANTTKPLVGPGLNNGNEAKAIIKIALALRNGNREELAAKPPCAPFIPAITPLYFTSEAVEALEIVALSGLPLMALTNPVMGATAPYTIAGTVSLGHAEELAIAVMAHTIRPGLPILSFNTPTIADMHTMASTTGGPETGLMRSLVVKLANYLGIPSWGHGHTSSARLDEQASDEKSINSLLIANARPSLLGGLGGLANVTLTSYETMVMDNERFGALKRVLREVAVDEDHLAYSVIADVINGQNIISHEHTVKYLRGKEVWEPKLAHRQGLVSGKPESKSMVERAREEARDIIENHNVEPLPEDVQKALDEIMNEYDEKIKELKKFPK